MLEASHAVLSNRALNPQPIQMTGLGTYMCLRQRKRLSGVENRVDTNSALAILSTPMWTRISGETKSTKR